MTGQDGRTAILEPVAASSVVVEGKMPLRVFVDMCPPPACSPNARTKVVGYDPVTNKPIKKGIHWREKAAAVRTFREAAGWSAVQGRMEYLGRDPLFDTFVPGDPIFAGPVAITAVIGWGKGRKTMDATNAQAALKAAIDGLQDANIFANDKQVVRLDVRQERDRDLARGYVEFIIIPEGEN
jgi:hypothetical protein